MRFQLLSAFNSQKIGGKSRIGEIDFGCFDNSFSVILVVGIQLDNDVTCFQD
jgi:hypothetical protein